MKFLVLALSVPFIVLSRIAEFFDIWGIHTEINSCLDVIDSSKDKVPLPFLLTLITAEDHRNAFHQGIDPIAMVRSAYVRIRYGQVQGASTIEQQLVRVVTGRFDRTINRKVREQILAIAISRRRSKLYIASAYLSIAFYGSGCIGVNGLRSRCGNDLTYAEQNDILGMISRLKYPEPLQPTSNWKRKLHRRIKHIGYREARSANKANALGRQKAPLVPRSAYCRR